jgi:hypothetical protein
MLEIKLQFIVFALWVLISEELIYGFQVLRAPHHHRHKHRIVATSRIKSQIMTSNQPPYVDNAFDFICIKLGTIALQLRAPSASNQYTMLQLVLRRTTFLDFVTVTKRFLLLPPQQIRTQILQFLKDVVPFPVKAMYKACFNMYPRFVAEGSTIGMTTGFLAWLVGPCERIDVPIVDTVTNTTGSWKSGIKLTECRYLAESGCKAACLHICKGPTQVFFAQDMGIPLHMKPNFDDNSCELFFGVVPPPDHLDPSYGEACFAKCQEGYKAEPSSKCS